jgi:group I intron endonuclease
MMNSGIYQIQNTLNNKCYIGSAANLKQRLSHHLRALNGNSHCNTHLQRSWNKYGNKCFEFRILLYCAKEDLLFYEQRAIDSYRANAGGYNLRVVASSNLGIKMSEDTILKIAMAQRGNSYAKGYRHTEETKAKLSAIHKGRKKPDRSREHRLRLSQALKGRKYSEETRKRMSTSKIGFHHSEETKLKMTERRGWHHTEETKQKLREAKARQDLEIGNPRIGTTHSEETKQRLSEGKREFFADRIRSEHVRTSISISNRTRIESEDTKNKRAESIRAFYADPERSREARRKISESSKMRHQKY